MHTWCKCVRCEELNTVLSMITGLVSETLVVMRNSCQNKVIEENLLLLPIKPVLPFHSIFVSGGLLKHFPYVESTSYQLSSKMTSIT